ncbi:hypothetical protein GALMADRAFT_53579 [Galerina marginata CBS 339.88]|uniref:G-protein coupled receptors family 1 profile domain-containing protein n=1 Tax=Galerina marginata (strain CBS 339.88) TaxID=685588 RepID=A0A067U2Z5_GALM3|nr:hypothetical protein GALMADRAFT_53579 [Galerina marginata CBS 339.88]
MGSTPYYGPDESAEEIFLERTFLAGDFICGLGYGIQVVLYTSCALFLWNARRSRGRQSLFLLAYISLLFVVETIFVAVQARTVQVIYIDNRNYPGGPWAYFLATQYLAINVMFYATLFILTFLADLLVLWRCWVIWSGSGRLVAYCVVTFPALMILASFVMGTLWTLESSQPGLSLYSALPMAFGTSYYVISLSVNIILTILITARLFMYRRRVVATLTTDHGSHYFSLATIIVESAAIYSVFALMFIISYAVNNPINQIFLAVASSAQQIAGYLIIYRLAEGRAWKRETFAHEGRLQTLRFMDTTSHGTEMTTSNLETPVDGGSLRMPFSKDGKISRIVVSVDQEILEDLPY